MQTNVLPKYLAIFLIYFYEFISANSSSFLMVFDRTLRMIKLYSKTAFLDQLIGRYSVIVIKVFNIFSLCKRDTMLSLIANNLVYFSYN